jgi:hypothetical protein
MLAATITAGGHGCEENIVFIAIFFHVVQRCTQRFAQVWHVVLCLHSCQERHVAVVQLHCNCVSHTMCSTDKGTHARAPQRHLYKPSRLWDSPEEQRKQRISPKTLSCPPPNVDACFKTECTKNRAKQTRFALEDVKNRQRILKA